MQFVGCELPVRAGIQVSERQIAVCPTLGSAPGATKMPPQLLEILRLSGLTQETRYQKIVAMSEAGVRLVSGTDGGINPGKPHGILAQALAQLVLGGMTPADALASATSVAAEVCGVADVAGTLEPGKDADILAVAGDPLADITAIHDVVAVYARGRQAVGPA